VIVLDEPTNDLDAETLELLESRLVEFPGTVLVVSHDRAFLNNVVTSTIVFEDDGPKEYVGGYDDWLRQRNQRTSELPTTPSGAPAKLATFRPTDSASPSRKRRLSYKEQQELSALPAAVEQLDGQIGDLHEAMARDDFYRQTREAIAAQQAQLKALEVELAAAYERWETLEQQAE